MFVEIAIYMLYVGLMMITDNTQREQALNFRQSFIVQAPAGSGKTELLIQRCLILLTKVTFPEEIIAITFTRKAAAEMKHRVVQSMFKAQEALVKKQKIQDKTVLLATKALQRDKKLNWNLLDNPNRLRFTTIDALCVRLMHADPLAHQWPADIQVAENPYYLYKEAAQNFFHYAQFEHYEYQTIVKIIANLNKDFNVITDIFSKMLANREQWLAIILQLTNNYNSELLKNNMQQNLCWLQNYFIEKFHNYFSAEEIKNLEEIIHYSANNLIISGNNNADSKIIIAAQNTTSNNIIFWQAVTIFIFTKSFSLRKSFTINLGLPSDKDCKQSNTYKNKLRNIISKFFDNNIALLSLFNIFTNLPNSNNDDEIYGTIHELSIILKNLTGFLYVLFKERKIIDFIEINQIACSILGEAENPSELALNLDYKIQHLLIDEFQDTSLQQFELIQKLTAGWQYDDGRTIFLVGDPMQSIYRFRQAEVNLFVHICQHGMPNLQIQHIKLCSNFRSQKNIVSWINKVFRNCMPQYNDKLLGLTNYNTTNEILPEQQNYNPEINIFANEQEHYSHVIQKIAEIKNKFPEDSIAILVRNRSNLNSLFKLIHQYNLAIEAIDIQPLASRSFTQDILILTTCLINVHHKNSWIALLRAPWCGLSLTELEEFSLLPKDVAIWQALNQNEFLQKFTADTKNRLKILLHTMQLAINIIDRLPLHKIVYYCWCLLGGPLLLNSDHELQDVYKIIAIIEKMENQHKHIFITEIWQRIQHLYSHYRIGNDKNPIQIMTIHRAKGLAFDHVFVLNVTQSSKNDPYHLLQILQLPNYQAYNQYKNNILLASVITKNKKLSAQLFIFLHKLNALKQNAEVMRLLYVAATRSRKNLQLSGVIPYQTQKNNWYPVNKNSLIAGIYEFVKDEINFHIPQSSLENNEYDQKQNCKSRKLKILQLNNKNKVFYDIKQKITKKSTNNPQKYPLLDNSNNILGTICHLIMRNLCIYGEDYLQRLQNKRYIYNLLANMNLSLTAIQHTLPKIELLSHNLATDKRAKWLCQTHSELNEYEQEYQYINDSNEIKTIIIDRLFIDNNTLWLIDYKTSMKYSTITLSNQKKQLQKYVKVIQKKYPYKIRTALYFPLIPTWKEIYLEV